MPAHLSIQYTGGDPTTYGGVSLRLERDGEAEVFNTGDPTVDYLTAGLVARFRAGPDFTVLCSSTVDHFVMDGGGLEDQDPPNDKVLLATKAARDYMVARGEQPHPCFGGLGGGAGYELGQILYRATVHPEAGWLRASPDATPPAEDPRIWYEEFLVVKVTAKGAWVTRHWRDRTLFQDTDTSVRRWVPSNGKFCSATKADALGRLRARTRSYVKHARRRLKDAEDRAAVLGITVPESLGLGVRGWNSWGSDY